MTASGDQDDLDAVGVGSAEGCEVGFRNFEFRAEEGAVDVDGDEAERIGGHGLILALAFWRLGVGISPVVHFEARLR